MTDETIGDPPAPSGRPRARVVATPAGTIRRRGRRAHPQAATQPIRHALSPHQTRTYRRRRPPAQEQDRKMTGSFTRPTGRTSSQRSRRPTRLPQPPPLHRRHHRLPCMIVMRPAMGRPRRPHAAEFPRRSEPEASSLTVPRRSSPAPLTPRGAALNAERPTPSSPSPSASAPVSTRMTSPPHAGSWPRPPTASRVNSDGVHRWWRR